MDKYRPCPSIFCLFTSGSQHPPRSRHAVYLGGNGTERSERQTLYINVLKYSFLYTFMLIYMFCINYNTLIPYTCTDDF